MVVSVCRNASGLGASVGVPGGRVVSVFRYASGLGVCKGGPGGVGVSVSRNASGLGAPGAVSVGVRVLVFRYASGLGVNNGVGVTKVLVGVSGDTSGSGSVTGCVGIVVGSVLRNASGFGADV